MMPCKDCLVKPICTTFCDERQKYESHKEFRAMAIGALLEFGGSWPGMLIFAFLLIAVLRAIVLEIGA